MKNWVGKYFPCYSPDINGPIEKVWRECARRVLARCDEIHGRADMKRVIKEEWDGLEFEETDHWCGINHPVDNVKECLEMVVEENGFGTYYMKH